MRTKDKNIIFFGKTVFIIMTVGASYSNYEFKTSHIVLFFEAEEVKENHK